MYVEEGRQRCPTNVLYYLLMRLEQQFSKEATRPFFSETFKVKSYDPFFSDKEKSSIAVQYKEMVRVNETFIGKLKVEHFFRFTSPKAFLYRTLHNYLVEPHQQELKQLRKYSQGPSHDHFVLL